MQNKLIIRLLACLLLNCLWMCQSTFAQATAKLEYQASMNMNGLYFWYSNPQLPAALFNREITPKGDSLDIVNGYAFLAWYKGGMHDRNLMLSRMKLGTNKWITIEFPEKNTLYTTTHLGVDYSKSPGGDSHRVASVGISTIDGTVHLMYDNHADPLHYQVSKKNIAFAADAEFKLANFFPERNYLRYGEPINTFTYPNLKRNDAGELILNFRVGASRQGDLTMTYYNGLEWSPMRTLIKGNNAKPYEFNTYGGLAYDFGKMYMVGAIRVKNSPIGNNQGIYFAETGQRGDGIWKSISGKIFQLPLGNIEGLKIAEPIKQNSDVMGSAPSFVATKNGALHFTAFVTKRGITHYYRAPGATTITESANAPGHLSFSAADRVYSVAVDPKKGVVIKSTPENKSEWRTDFTYGAIKFAAASFNYYEGKIYMIAAENIESDKRPFHQLIIDLGINTNQKPTLSFEAPTGDITVNKNYRLRTLVKATDTDGSIENVRLYIDGKPIRQDNTAPYEWGDGTAINPNELNGLSAGKHVVKATATDNEGAISEASFTLTVNNSGTSSSAASRPASSAISSKKSSSAASSIAAFNSTCAYLITSEWTTGFTSSIRIKNNGTSNINGWSVSWGYTDGSKITSSWNATITGNMPYTATNLSWNSVIKPGEHIEFGVQGNKGTNSAPQKPVLNGAACK